MCGGDCCFFCLVDFLALMSVMFHISQKNKMYSFFLPSHRVCAYENGQRYEGMWRGGLKDGRGRLVLSNGAAQYEGRFREDVLDGRWKMSGLFLLMLRLTWRGRMSRRALGRGVLRGHNHQKKRKRIW